MSNICIVLPYSFPSKDGIWKRATDDISELNNFNIDFVSSTEYKGQNEELPAKSEFDGTKIYRFKSFFSLGLNSMFFFHFRTLWRLKPDLIHTHGYRHPHSIQALIVGKLMRKKVIITPHAPFNKDPRRPLLIKFFDRAYDLLIGWWELRLYDEVILTTNWEAKYLKRLGVKDEKIHFILNGINPKFLNLGQDGKLQHSANKRDIDVFFMGRLDPVKRLEWVKDAAKNLPNYKFEINGPLSDYDEFKSNSENLKVNVSAYEFDDFIKKARKSKIYVLPSARESFGMTMLEAMSQGCIVISSNTDGAQNVIKNGENGFIVNSSKEMTEKIKEVLEKYESLETIRENAIKTAQNFSSEITSSKMKELYDNILLRN